MRARDQGEVGAGRPGRFRRAVLPAVVLGAAGYFALFGGEYSFFELRRLERQRTEEARRLEVLRDSVAALRARADSLERDDATLERVARERFGLVRDGERLYRFVPDSGPAPGRAPEPGGAAGPPDRAVAGDSARRPGG